MSQHRLAILLVVLGVLAGLRVAVPLGQEAELVGVPEKILRGGAREPSAMVVEDKSNSAAASNDWADHTRDLDDGPPGNAFQARVAVVVPPPAPALPRVVKAPPPAVAATAATVSAVARAPDPGPSLRVIGSWQDELGISVFVVTATGMLQRRAGDALPGGYSLSGISPQFLRIRQLSSGDEISVPVPPGVIAVSPPAQ